MTNERKVTIKTVTVLSDRLPQPSGVDGNVLTEEGGVIEWKAPVESGDVRASDTDTAPGTLMEKLHSGDNITLTLEHAGGNEQVLISAGSEPAQADLHLAVDPILGSDTPSVDRPSRLYGGDYTAYPFATIQAAVDSLPNPWNNDCEISLAAGVHPAGVSVVNLMGTGGIQLHSVELEIDTGNATSGSNRTLQDTTKSWTPGEHAGRFLLCPDLAGLALPIRSNTSDTITLAAHSYIGSVIPGSQYWIYDVAATIDGDVQLNDSLSPTNGFLLQLVKLGAGRSINGAGICCTISNVIVPSGALNLSRCSIVSLDHSTFNNGSILLVDIGLLLIWETLAMGSPQVGVWIESCPLLAAIGISVVGAAEHGLYLSNVNFEDLPWGAYLEAIDNAGNGLYLRKGTQCRLDGFHSMEGTGNGAFGVEVDSFCELVFKGSPVFPTLTGTMGDLTIDRGATALGWIADFSTDGDLAVSPNLFSRAERNDT